MTDKIAVTVLIKASSSEIWEYLTDPNKMRKWMGEPEMNIEIVTDWKIGNSISIKGLHHINFENKGTILKFDPLKTIQYTHLSSVSRLSDIRENYSIITFLITPIEKMTRLEVMIKNFPTESIYKHLNFYWQGTMNVLKNLIEREEIKTTKQW